MLTKNQFTILYKISKNPGLALSQRQLSSITGLF